MRPHAHVTDTTATYEDGGVTHEMAFNRIDADHAHVVIQSTVGNNLIGYEFIPIRIDDLKTMINDL